jgi:hypothetical protein
MRNLFWWLFERVVGLAAVVVMYALAAAVRLVLFVRRSA